MSTANIVFKGYSSEGYIVVFDTRNGQRAYEYPRSAGPAIDAGADPRAFPGTEIPVPSAFAQFGLNTLNTIEEIGEAGAEIAAL